MKSKILIFLVAIVYLYILFNRFDWKKNHVLEWDRAGYYSYLPALFIYRGIESLDFYPAINKKYHIATPDISYYATYLQEATGKRLNKYTIGVAVAEFPFFWLGHFFTHITNQYPADGFSTYYQLSVLLSSIAWTLIGLIFMRSLLQRFFNDIVTSITLITLALGTNLYHYTAFDGGMSHCFSFANEELYAL